MSILSVLGDVANVALRVGRIVLPILGVLRQANPEIDEALDTVDEVIREGGEAADDWLDANDGTLGAIEEFAQDAQVAFAKLEELVVEIREAAADNTITPDEVAGLVDNFDSTKDALRDLFRGGGELEEQLKALTT